MRGLEILLGLIGETDDEIARDCHVRHDRPRLFEHLQVMGGRVVAVHRLEDAIRPALGGHVQVSAHLRRIRHHTEDVLQVLVAGIARHKPDPLDAGNLGRHVEQVGQAVGPLPVGVLIRVDGLAQERDLANPGVRQFPHLRQDRLRRTAGLRAADIGHDTIRTEVVAPTHHANERLPGDLLILEAMGRLEIVESRVAAFDRTANRLGHGQTFLVANQRLHDQLRQLRNLSRAADDVDSLMGQERIAKPLGHTADDRDDHAGPMLFEVLEVPKVREHPVLRMLPDRTGVDDDRVGLLDALGKPKTGILKRDSHQPRVQLVHLASEALDVNGTILHNDARIRLLR